VEGLGLGTQPQSMGLGLYSPQQPDLVTDWIRSIAAQNKDKNFIQRIMDPHVFPNLDLGNGQVGTHLMSWGTLGKDKTPIVYPSIIQDEQGGMKQLNDDEAFDYATTKGEYITLPSEHLADLFTREYKRLWDK
jgi:hypothetical protein